MSVLPGGEQDATCFLVGSRMRSASVRWAALWPARWWGAGRDLLPGGEQVGSCFRTVSRSWAASVRWAGRALLPVGEHW